MSDTLYDIYYDGQLIKENCKLQAIIPKGYVPSLEEISKYYGIDIIEMDEVILRRMKKPYQVNRLVFDKCVVPETAFLRVKIKEEINV